ncbi:hypothetical protein NKI86_31565, partial [Mesorhizobium sp. M0320]|uniref:hypothetical protein n=1 Tax=Mesorhizobium sp. M0320 TaxID=2956936 RepID=UPI003339BC94
LDYDGDTSVFWINEGTGFDYWLDGHFDLPGPGRYLISDVTGHYHRGDWGFTEDEEEWEIGLITRTELDTLV